jgi:hypothetical protein
MSAHPSKFVTERIYRAETTSSSTTDLVKRAVADELERQRDGLDALKNLRGVAIKVKIPPMAGGTRAVLISFDTGTER